MNETVMMLVLAITTCVLVFIAGAIGSYHFDKKSCFEIANKLGYTAEYNVYTGCIVTNKNGKKIILNQLMEVD